MYSPCDTIAKMIANGYELSAHCEARCDGFHCHHRAKVDLHKLAERLGPDHGTLAADLAGKLRCSKCESKQMGITIHPPNRGGRVIDERVGYIMPPGADAPPSHPLDATSDSPATTGRRKRRR